MKKRWILPVVLALFSVGVLADEATQFHPLCRTALELCDGVATINMTIRPALIPDADRFRLDLVNETTGAWLGGTEMNANDHLGGALLPFTTNVKYPIGSAAVGDHLCVVSEFAKGQKTVHPSTPVLIINECTWQLDILSYLETAYSFADTHGTHSSVPLDLSDPNREYIEIGWETFGSLDVESIAVYAAIQISPITQQSKAHLRDVFVRQRDPIHVEQPGMPYGGIVRIPLDANMKQSLETLGHLWMQLNDGESVIIVEVQK